MGDPAVVGDAATGAVPERDDRPRLAPPSGGPLLTDARLVVNAVPDLLGEGPVPKGPRCPDRATTLITPETAKIPRRARPMSTTFGSMIRGGDWRTSARAVAKRPPR
ncbi:MAG: hypothetical protein AVDCRST_MAG19-1058 [uncultured Thermomicrobiales bacterium]|uniref:Uncharacterized protein n=1 Tax=uncultured Thermomicrobiales bacterium TaxID=1645740 RepID=A0A6J4UNG7_9BACT|nr:MAG: hypothetical protein AVDCRST_MAG19-1058 [uncultured Thermomicrobiales bacterium]